MKLKSWHLMIISAIVVPLLRRIADAVVKKAESTPNEWDDVAASALQVVVELLGNTQQLVELMGAEVDGYD